MIPETADDKKCLMVVTGIYGTGGGIASVNRLVARGLVEEGYRLDILALIEEEALIPDFAARDVHYRRFGGDKWAFARAAWQAQARNEYALVFCDHVNVAALLAVSRLGLRRPYVVWVHGDEVYPPKPTREGRIGLNLAAVRLTSSEFTRDVVLNHLPAKSTIACDLALEPDRWGLTLPDDPPQASGTSPALIAIDGQQRALGEQVILHVGRMDARQRHKGHEVLIHAFPAILGQHPEAQLVLAGGGDDLAYLKAIGQTLPVNAQQSIFMPGYVTDEDLGELYQHCCLFAMPSRAEGFGIVYMEAMRWAKPCLGSRVDAASCVIADGETGLLVDDPGSAVEVAAKINRLLDNPEEAASMGIRGYDRVRERYLFPRFKERFFNALAIEPRETP